MIDFLKLNISHLSKSDLLNNSLFEWEQCVNLNTAELNYPIIGKYFNMKIKINPSYKVLSGSIHILSNEIKKSRNQNHNDFNYDKLKEMIFHLQEVFKLKLDEIIIQNLEIGLNINTLKTPEGILKENLIVWNSKEPSTNNEYNGKGKYIEFVKSQYFVKIYDKGKQYNQTENILRFECKIMRNEYLNKYGINTLNDLLDKVKLRLLQDFLFDTFKDCLIVDNNSTVTIVGPKEREIFKDGINPKYWSRIKGMRKKRFKDSFNQILEKYSLNTIKKEIENSLKAKGEKLMNCYEMNDFQNIQSDSQNNEMLRNEPYIYIHNITVRKCIITGIDITDQKGDSLFLSENSIFKIHETDGKEFERLNNEFGPKTGDYKTLNELCYYIAHNIRNRDSNKRHEIKRKTEYYKNSLFPLDINSIIENNNNLQYGI